MSNMRCVFFILFFILGFAKMGFAIEVSHFDILLFGDKVGTLTISKELRADGTELYILDSYSKAKVLWINRENTTHYEVVYKNGKLCPRALKKLKMVR
jgi:hypothetical protein